MSNIGHIYKLTCSETGKLYIGSTIQTLKKRLCKHLHNSNGCVSRDFINPKIQLIETIEYTDYEKLLWRERFHVETTDCVNQVIPIRTKEERKQYLKEYHEEHKQELNESSKKYNEEHKQERKEYDKKYKQENKEKIKKYREENEEKIRKQRYEKFNCECGGKYTRCQQARHFKTKKHQGWIAMKLLSK